MEEDRLAEIIGKNLTRLRKMANLTQMELAEKLQYSDKSISKWEQGNGIPDVRILLRLADLFHVTVDDLVREQRAEVIPKPARGLRRLIITFCSVGLCWLVAVVSFVLMGLFAPEGTASWLAFVYAVPVSAVVVLVFSCIWRWKFVRILSLSLLIWTALACVFLTAFVIAGEVGNLWLIFLIGLPLQGLALFFFVWWKRAHFFRT